MKVQTTGGASLRQKKACALYIIMLCCFMVFRVDVMAKSFTAIHSQQYSAASPASFSSTSSYRMSSARYSSAASQSAGSWQSAGASVQVQGIYTSTKGIKTTSAASLHSSTTNTFYTGRISEPAKTANSGSNAGYNTTFNATYPASNLSLGKAGKPTTSLTLTGGRFNSGLAGNNLAVQPMVSLNDFTSASPRKAPPGIYASFIAWLETTGKSNPAWAYDDDQYWYYNMTTLQDLWEQYREENNLPYTWDVFRSWFFSYETDPALQDKYRAPVGNGSWIMMALAVVYVIYRICKKNLKHIKL